MPTNRRRGRRGFVKGRGFPPGDLASRRSRAQWFGFDIGAKLLAAYAAHLKSLMEIQSKAIDAGISAFAIKQAELSSAIAARPLNASWIQLRDENAAAWAQLVTSWFHLMAQAQAAMLEAVGQTLSEQYLAASRQAPPWVRVGMERRQHSVVIRFPERRRTVS
jgi:hypothetical protein